MKCGKLKKVLNVDLSQILQQIAQEKILIPFYACMVQCYQIPSSQCTKIWKLGEIESIFKWTKILQKTFKIKAKTIRFLKQGDGLKNVKLRNNFKQILTENKTSMFIYKRKLGDLVVFKRILS